MQLPGVATEIVRAREWDHRSLFFQIAPDDYEPDDDLDPIEDLN